MEQNSQAENERTAKALFGKGRGDPLTVAEQERVREYLWTREKGKVRDQKRSRKMRIEDFRKMVGAAVTLSTEPVESPIEERLSLALGTRSICAGMIKTQFDLGPYRIDIAFPNVKMAIECDGRAYHSTPGQIAHDQRRDQYMAGLGWTVLRFTGSRIHRDLSGCLDDVTKAYERLSSADAWE